MQNFETIRRSETTKKVVKVGSFYEWEYSVKVTYVTLDKALEELSQTYFSPDSSQVEYSAQNGQNVPAMRDLFDRAQVLARSVGDESRFEELYIP